MFHDIELVDSVLIFLLLSEPVISLYSLTAYLTIGAFVRLV